MHISPASNSSTRECPRWSRWGFQAGHHLPPASISCHHPLTSAGPWLWRLPLHVFKSQPRAWGWKCPFVTVRGSRWAYGNNFFNLCFARTLLCNGAPVYVYIFIQTHTYIYVKLLETLDAAYSRAQPVAWCAKTVGKAQSTTLCEKQSIHLSCSLIELRLSSLGAGADLHKALIRSHIQTPHIR